MFGLIYEVIIEGKDIDIARKEEMLEALRQKISEFKHDDNHKNYPSLLKHIRNRVEQSIRIFNRYV